MIDPDMVDWETLWELSGPAASNASNLDERIEEMEMEKELRNARSAMSNNSKNNDTKKKDEEEENKKKTTNTSNEVNEKDKDEGKEKVRTLATNLDSRKTERLIQRGIDVWNSAFDKYIKDGALRNNSQTDSDTSHMCKEQDNLYLPEGIEVSDRLGDEVCLIVSSLNAYDEKD